MPHDQLAPAAKIENHGWTIARLLCAERAPEFPARFLVERHSHAPLAADQADKFPAVNQWMPGKTPYRRLDPVILFQVMRPDDGAFLPVTTEQISYRAERINLSFADRRRGARAGGITHGVGAIVFVFPKNCAVRFVQAQDPFRARNRALVEWIGRMARALAELVIQKVNAAVGDRRSRVAGVDGSAPANLRAAGRKCFENARLAPDSVALGAEPLRPVIGVRDERHQRTQRGQRR